MSSQTQQAVAYSGSSEDKKLTELVSYEIPQPNADQLLIKAVAFATNPTDYKHFLGGWGAKGTFAGSDVSGEVVAIGANVKGFEVGDHVSSFDRGGNKKKPHVGLFKEYSVVDPYLTFRYPKKLKTLGADVNEYPSSKVDTFEGAAAINLGIFTVGLTYSYAFGLDFDKAKNADKTVLIWGGATATGLLAIQVAKKVYGLKVVAAASKKHESSLKSFGADAVFDYHDSDVVSQIKAFSGDSLVYGYDTVANLDTWNAVNDSLTDSTPVVADNLLFLEGSALKNPKKNAKYTKTLVYLARGEDQELGDDFVLKSSPEIAEAHLKFYKNIVPFVQDGTIQHQPLRILHDGLSSVDEAFSLLRNNKVSAEKIVFKLSESK
ncbi:unnamed protein product [Kuraishia capsulata CBS 1993]|uniref:Enoyl reductase (ER) domain-containing protein n=1 Tax=Kuraishia capsulata CBS 1993 TaxID=1382522 RepID=W6MWW4_9ASCO|nr:uncharacterized protein KUCA_T00003945001 [Kuraishia capsulata CBS 1993]CDK27965.1 unnamed protein product [Kuraishia capsulata CBS 1993]